MPKPLPKTILDEFYRGIRSLGHAGSFRPNDTGMALLCKHCQASFRLIYRRVGKNASYGLYYVGYNWAGQLMISRMKNSQRVMERIYVGAESMYVCPRVATWL